MTYDELLVAIESWANTPEISEFAPTFVQLAEARFNRVLRVSQMVGRSTLTTNSVYFALPADFLEAISVRQAATNAPLVSFVTPNQMDALRLDTTFDGQGAQHYTIIDTNLQVWPDMSEGEIELTYYKKIPALGSATQTNWLIERAPDAYLYGSLLQMEGYLGKDARVPLWVAALQSVLDELNAESERNRYPRSGGLVMRARGLG